MLEIDGVQPDSVTFVCPLREVFFLLYGHLSAYDLDPEYTFTYMGMLVDDVMVEEHSRDPVGGGGFDDVVEELSSQGRMSEDDAKRLCYQAGDLIILLVTQQLPNMGARIYKNAYQYYLSPSYDLYISIQRSVFESYEPDRIPSTGPRPYRL